MQFLQTREFVHSMACIYTEREQSSVSMGWWGVYVDHHPTQAKPHKIRFFFSQLFFFWVVLALYIFSLFFFIFFLALPV